MGIEFGEGKNQNVERRVRKGYMLTVSLYTSSAIDPRQIIGEAVDDYNKNYGADVFADVMSVRKM